MTRKTPAPEKRGVSLWYAKAGGHIPELDGLVIPEDPMELQMAKKHPRSKSEAKRLAIQRAAKAKKKAKARRPKPFNYDGDRWKIVDGGIPYVRVDDGRDNYLMAMEARDARTIADWLNRFADWAEDAARSEGSK